MFPCFAVGHFPPSFFVSLGRWMDELSNSIGRFGKGPTSFLAVGFLTMSERFPDFRVAEFDFNHSSRWIQNPRFPFPARSISSRDEWYPSHSFLRSSSPTIIKHALSRPLFLCRAKRKDNLRLSYVHRRLRPHGKTIKVRFQEKKTGLQM